MTPSADSAPPHYPKCEYSVASLRELVFTCLETVSAGAVIEVGADRAEFTRELLAWGETTGAAVVVIEPSPSPELLELARQNPALEVIESKSIDALRDLNPFDAYVIDGDHNYFTVREELRLIDAGARARGGFPLVILHDVGWPWARRDTYFAPEGIEEDQRHPAVDASIAPGVPTTVGNGIRLGTPVAPREGGERNGVLTAVEDFMRGRNDLRWARVPAFFGLGFLYPAGVSWSSRLGELLAPWDDNPLLARLERDRLGVLLGWFKAYDAIGELRADAEAERDRLEAENARLRERQERARLLVEPMILSRALLVAKKLSALRRGRNEPTVSRSRLRRAIDQE